MSHTIVIVDDEQDILDLLSYSLQKDGYCVICLTHTENVFSILDAKKVDLLIMDRNLPGVEGSLFVKEIKEAGYNMPVIYLSAKNLDKHILEGFERYGDDYITKPFNLNIVKSRIKALLKRTNKQLSDIQARDIVYKAEQKKFFIAQEEVALSSLEKRLLLEFINNQDRLLSRDALIEHVWDNNPDIKLKTINVAIKRLKEKIDPLDAKKYILSVRGEGYIFC